MAGGNDIHRWKNIGLKEIALEKMVAALELPENEEVLMVMDLGYAAEGIGPLSNHTNRKAIEQTVTLMEQRC